MNSRRVMLTQGFPRQHTSGFNQSTGRADVRFGSKADMCSALADVRFVPCADIAARLLNHLDGGI